MSDNIDKLDFERDMPLTAEDRRVLNQGRRRRIDPSQLEWDWISLAAQFPTVRQDRPTSEGWVEFEL